jgi:hypothetical protein
MRGSVSSEAGPTESTITENISSTGCYFAVQQDPPPVGTAIEMEIAIPAAKDGKVRCSGRVVRMQKVAGEEKTGVACTIDQYQIVGSSQATEPR